MLLLRNYLCPTQEGSVKTPEARDKQLKLNFHACTLSERKLPEGIRLQTTNFTLRGKDSVNCYLMKVSVYFRTLLLKCRMVGWMIRYAFL